MLWTPQDRYVEEPFETEAELESAIKMVRAALFGPNRIYLHVKKLIGAKGGIKNVPDAYLVDLSSTKQPTLWVVENELENHDPFRHVAVQILQMSLSFQSSQQKIKSVVKGALKTDLEAWNLCESYAKENGFDNIDFLLEQMVHQNPFQALVIIDELQDELETLLVSRFKFPVEVLTLKRYRNKAGEHIYEFEPLLSDISSTTWGGVEEIGQGPGPTVDASEIDTIVVPARDEGFENVFLGEDRWWEIRLHTSRIPKIKYIDAYRVAPTSAITHVAPVDSIEPWHDTGKYVLNFTEPAQKLDQPRSLVSKGKVPALRGPRYTSYERLMQAKILDEVFYVDT
jgi:hypothetical protein